MSVKGEEWFDSYGIEDEEGLCFSLESLCPELVAPKLQVGKNCLALNMSLAIGGLEALQPGEQSRRSGHHGVTCLLQLFSG